MTQSYCVHTGQERVAATSERAARTGAGQLCYPRYYGMTWCGTFARVAHIIVSLHIDLLMQC